MWFIPMISNLSYTTDMGYTPFTNLSDLIKPDVSTICVGMAASMGTVLLCSGAAGKRFALPNSTIHMHQPLSGAQGQASDIDIAAREILRLQDKMRQIISHHSGQPYDKVARDTDRDYYLTSEKAQEYGLIDKVLSSSDEKDKNKKDKK